MNQNDYISSMTPNLLSKDETQAQPSATSQPVSPFPDNPVAEVTLGNVKKYITAEMSLQLYGPVRDKVFDARKAQCLGCEHRFDSDKMKDPIGFCRACGCGVNQRAALSVKLKMPSAYCPKGKWASSNGRHAKLKDRMRALLLRFLLK